MEILVLIFPVLLEKSFVVFRLKSYSTNRRKEVSKMKKIYFWDNGIRNAMLGDFREPALRSDLGALWENLMVTERLKRNHYLQKKELPGSGEASSSRRWTMWSLKTGCFQALK